MIKTKKVTKTIYVASFTTGGGATYLYAFETKKSSREVAKLVWEREGKCADLDFYIADNSYELEKVEVLP